MVYHFDQFVRLFICVISNREEPTLISPKKSVLIDITSFLYSISRCVCVFLSLCLVSQLSNTMITRRIRHLISCKSNFIWRPCSEDPLSVCSRRRLLIFSRRLLSLSCRRSRVGQVDTSCRPGNTCEYTYTRNVSSNESPPSFPPLAPTSPSHPGSRVPRERVRAATRAIRSVRFSRAHPLSLLSLSLHRGLSPLSLSFLST